MSLFEACAKVILLGSVLVFFLQYQGSPCSISLQLFLSRETGQMFVRRGGYCRAEGPRH